MVNQWLIYALGSAFFAALTAILGKLGVSEMNSNMATFLRVVVIIIMTVTLITFRKEWQPLNSLSPFGATMILFSGLATGLSWLCYYRALQLAPVSRVAPIDKLSVALAVLFAVLFLGETLSWKMAAGCVLIISGVVLLAL